MKRDLVKWPISGRNSERNAISPREEMFPEYFCKLSQGQLPKNGACGISHVALSIDNGCQFGN